MGRAFTAITMALFMCAAALSCDAPPLYERDNPVDPSGTEYDFTFTCVVYDTDSVWVVLSGAQFDSVLVDNGEQCAFTVSKEGAFTITPKKTGYYFTPENKYFDLKTIKRFQEFYAHPDTTD